MVNKSDNSLKLNMFLYAVKSVMGILFPLITFPYVSRILGVDNLGRYNFSLSIINYFVLFSGLGISTYAIREGARLRDDPIKFKKLADELFSINIISTGVSYLILTISLVAIPKFQGYLNLLIILSIQIIFRTIGIDWIYSIYEDYAYITVRSIIFQIISLILLFGLVKTQKDINIYAAITVFSNAGANVANYIHARKYCRIGLTLKIDWGRHIYPILVLFAMSATVSIYVSSDTTILGFLCNDTTVGIYYVSSKIYSVIKTILSSVLVVSIPRLAAMLGKENINEFSSTAKDIYGTLLTILLPIVIGIIILRKQIVLLTAGEEFIEASSSLFLLAIATLFCFGAYFWGQCVLIPMKYENFIFRITLLGALVNIILNFLLIPIWKENAAAFTTIVAEGLVYIFCRHEGKKHLKMQGLYRLILKILIGCLAILLVNIIMSHIFHNIVGYTICTVAFSIILYSITEILLKNEILCGIINSAKAYIES